MEKENLFRDLQIAIVEIERKQLEEEIALRQQFKDVVDGFRPIQLIKETLNEVTDSVKLKDNLVTLLMSISAGYVSKKLIESGSKNIFKKIVGNIAMFGITNLVSKHAETIKKWGAELMNFSTPDEPVSHTEKNND